MMDFLNVGDFVTDPALAQDFVLERRAGAFVAGSEGEWSVSAPALSNATGSIQPASANDMVKYGVEGLRADQAIKVYTNTALQYGTENAELSDVIQWRGERFRVAYARRWEDFGYTFAIAGRCYDV